MAALASGDGTGALEALRAAHALDRELGIPRRIFRDLVGMGRASELLGDRAAARGYYARALAVGEADRDAAGAAEARALLEALEGK
jgi:hypothetical protein